MKILTSNTEGVWCSPIAVIITEEDYELLASVNEADIVAKTILSETLKANRENPATSEDAAEAQTVYEFHKPVLTETDTYQLIAVDLRIEGTYKNGIINCRINGDHQQIRF